MHICSDHAIEITDIENELTQLSIYEKSGLINFNPATGWLTVEREARPTVRIIASIFDAYFMRNAAEKKHAKAV